MQWLTKIADSLEATYPTGDILVSSGVSPSGRYHVGTLREVLTADAVLIILKKRGRTVKHIHFVDDLDGLRKVPAGVPEEFSRYLGKPVCDIPSPEPESDSYANYYLEKALANIAELRACLEEVSGRQLTDEWSPIQVNIDGYLKKRPFKAIDTTKKLVTYLDIDDKEETISYANGDVKLDWRIDWPARWWQLGVHATKGGSYDTGKAIVECVFGGFAPVPVPYQFINRSGETKKMSKSAGNTVTISELLEVLPPEIIRYFILRSPPEKQLFFSQTDGLVRLIDEYAELLAKPDKTSDDEMLLFVCTSTLQQNTISNIPFSHLVASYQAALRDSNKTLEIIARTEHANIASEQATTIEKELAYIDRWLDTWADEDVKFKLLDDISSVTLDESQRKFLDLLSEKISSAPPEADGTWFHTAIYELKGELELAPKLMFSTLYQVLIGKDSGPRAGWFLSILPRDWLITRLKLKA